MCKFTHDMYVREFEICIGTRAHAGGRTLVSLGVTWRRDITQTVHAHPLLALLAIAAALTAVTPSTV